MANYCSLLLESGRNTVDDKPFNRQTYSTFSFVELDNQQRLDYIKYAMEDLQIPCKIRPSETRYKQYYVVFQNEEWQEFAKKQFELLSGLSFVGDTLPVGDLVVKFSFNLDARKAIASNGKYIEENDKDGWFMRFLDAVRQGNQLGSRLAGMWLKSRHQLAHDF